MGNWPSILVVDDEINNVKSLSRLLTLNNLSAITTTSGLGALDIIRDKKVDLILMDIMMPQLDGHQTCRLISEIVPHTPIIMMTALLDDAAMSNSFDSDAVDFIRKPINELELLTRIRNMLQIKSAEKKIRDFNDEIIDDLQTAAGVQSFLLPDWLIVDNNFTISSIYEAAQMVSGDLYDVIKLNDNETVVYVGDISGHGVQSALLMSAVEAVIKMIVKSQKQKISPQNILDQLNSMVGANLFHDKYMTLLIGVINSKSGTYEYFNAGHPPIIEVNKYTKKAKVIEDTGSIPIGWVSEIDYNSFEVNTIKLDQDCIYILYTDGLFECQNETGTMLGLDGLVSLIEGIPDSINEINLPYIIKKALIEHNYIINTDDLTVLTLMRNPKPALLDRHVFQLSAILKNVADIGSQCEELVLKSYDCAQLAAKVELIVNEFLNNVILHGIDNDGHLRPKIYIELITAKDIQIKIWDKGRHWNLPDFVTEPQDLFAEVDVNQESGRGINIIKTLTSKFEATHYQGLNEAQFTITV